MYKSFCTFLASSVFLSSVAAAGTLPATGNPDVDATATVLYDTIVVVHDHDPAVSAEVVAALGRVPSRLARASADGTLSRAEVYAVAVQAGRDIEAVAGTAYLGALCDGGTLPELCAVRSTSGSAWEAEVAANSALVGVDATYAAQLAQAWAEAGGGSEQASSSGEQIGEIIGGALGAIVGGVFGGAGGALAGFSIGGALGKMIGALFDSGDGAEEQPDGEEGTSEEGTGEEGTGEEGGGTEGGVGGGSGSGGGSAGS